MVYDLAQRAEYNKGLAKPYLKRERNKKDRSKVRKPWDYDGLKKDFLKNIDQIEKFCLIEIELINSDSFGPVIDDFYTQEHYDQDMHDYEKLLDAIRTINSRFDIKWTRKNIARQQRKGLRRDWESDGFENLELIIGAWERAGRLKRLSINPGGALVRVLVQALRYQGWDINEAGVARWLEQVKKISTKSRAISSAKREKTMGK